MRIGRQLLSYTFTQISELLNHEFIKQWLSFDSIMHLMRVVILDFVCE